MSDGAEAPPVGPLGMGGANLGNLYAAMSDRCAAEILAAAWDGGIRYFDTAPHYGLGLSERRLGAFLRGLPRDQVVVSTKVGRLLRPSPGTAHRTDEANGFAVPADHERVWDFSLDGVRRGLHESLERMGIDRVDVLYLHDPDESDDPAGGLRSATEALARLREEGTVRAIGVGSKSAETLRAAADTGVFDLLMVAGRLTLLEWDQGLVDSCARHGTGIVVAGVYNSGLLSRPDPSPDAHYEYGATPPDVWERARELADTCTAHGVELPTAALQFPFRRGHELVRGVVLGASSPEQVRSNLARLALPVPDELWARLDRTGAGVR
ncbi:aldo/keto reductase [Pseudonocardia acaciae]|uniref:aldo/keto reductase n=1 Tax=Pseudonocardia acaciae TaxID=551276 RepID=UPI001FDEE51F|nr:aldo/keto reductase [Pseudonocardia acaciae]